VREEREMEEVPFLEGHVETFKFEMIALSVAIFLAPLFELL
jgi:hypothetical protein